jgi:hypothetical protein
MPDPMRNAASRPGQAPDGDLLDERQWGPWTIAGGPDPDYDDPQRAVHHALLTDPLLLTCFRRRFPHRGNVDYDEMVRLLGYVWDCPDDGTANVTGYRCAVCGGTRASALG